MYVLYPCGGLPDTPLWTAELTAVQAASWLQKYAAGDDAAV
jgi:hypothetical protein